MDIRIMTYNIQSGRDARGNLDLNGCIGVIRELKPQICALNEVRMRTLDTNGAEQARLVAEATGMNYFFAKAIDYNGGDYGIALLSVFPILSAAAIPVPPLPEEERDRRYEDRVLLRSTLDIQGRPVTVMTSHFGLSAGEQANAVNLVLQTLDTLSTPAAFMGDLNVTPDNTVISALRTRLTDVNQNPCAFTFHALDPRITIDYIFLSPEFRERNTFVHSTEASDHLPLITDVTLTD